MTTPLKVLILEDWEPDVDALLRYLNQAGFELDWQWVDTEAKYLAHLQPDLDLILADYHLPEFGAPQALELLQESGLDIPFIIITGSLSEEIIVACMQQGASDYLLKDRPARLGEAVKQALKQKNLRQEKEHALEALRESEVRFRTIFEFAPTGMVIANCTGEILQTNQSFQKMIGYCEDELQRMTFMDIIHPDDYNESAKQQLELFQATTINNHFKQDRRYYAKGGGLVWSETLVFAAHDKAGNFQHTITLIRDITEQKDATAKLEQRAAQLALINDIGRQIAAVLELDAVLDKAAHLVQSLFDYHHVALFLMKGERLQLKAIAGSYTQYFPDQHIQSIDKGINGWVATHGQKLLANDVSNNPHYVSLISEHSVTQAELCLPIKLAHETVGVLDIQSPRLNGFGKNDVIAMEALTNQIAVAIKNARLYQQAQQEITERKQAQQALERERSSLAHRVEERTEELQLANAELAQASRLKDEFLASMSHELRTPLNAILGLTEAIQEQVFGPLTEKQAKLLRTVSDSGRHLLALINDILDLSKIGAGKVKLEVGPVSVERVCQVSLQFVKQAAHKKKINISFNRERWITAIEVDERRLKQILINLLSNAVKFTPAGGAIGLEVTSDTNQQTIHFTVWDTGIGIAEEDMGQLFQPFIQLDSRLSRQYGGTGLGLSLVYRLVEMHGGSIAVKSKPDKGSRFIVTLPWQKPAEIIGKENVDKKQITQEIFIHKPKPNPQNRETLEFEFSVPLLLLAEDNETNIKTFSDYLLTKGYRVIVVRNGTQVIEQLKQTRPDLILMDIQMPKMNGLEATRLVRANPDFAEIPIIALTALAMPGDEDQCLAAGANDYLSKPVGLKQLVKVIETQLNHHR